MSYDLVITGGSVVDGTGAPGYRADVAVKHGRIAAIGRIRDRSARTIEAEGQVVTPGFIDGHTHMDAQVMWDPLGTCSSLNGVTTVVTGNCGFTLAPVRPGHEDLVIRSIEKAEDISREAMSAGIEWSWSSFAEYLHAVERRPSAINYACNIGHSALRAWAMGEDAFEREANDAEIEAMGRTLAAALDVGAAGFTTSRSASHETTDGRPVASRLADWAEVQSLVEVLSRYPSRPFELALEPLCHSPEPAVREEALGRLKTLAVQTGVPITFGVLPTTSQRYDELLTLIEQTGRAGGRMLGQAAPRGVSVIMSFETRLPFDSLPGWTKLRRLDLAAQKTALKDPEVRGRLVEEAGSAQYGRGVGAALQAPRYGEILVYDHILPPHRSVAELAAERRCDPVEVMIDLALQSDMRQMFLQFYGVNPESAIEQIVCHPQTVLTFSDAGAHISQIADSSIQTYTLAYWVREKQVITFEEAIRRMSLVPSTAWGMHDRGIVREGFIADLNVIDADRVEPDLPTVRTDLPAGARRLHQVSTGVRSTLVAGEPTFEDGVHTGALPGRLLRRN
jgi:N-acyl-D-aspartate/D-glutamate deacylase